MTKLTKKICIIGDFGVGKTSTVARYVHNVFSEKYLTTVGVKIDTREIELADGAVELKLVIWDIAGTDRFSAVEFSYLRGAAGLLLVADGTRRHTVDVVHRLKREADERYGELPSVLMLNKHDLTELWELTDADIERLEAAGNVPFLTSAKSGENVESAILALADRLMA